MLRVLFDRMRYVAAYLLAVLGGNKSPSKKDITNILESVGLDVDDEQLNKVGSIVSSTFLGFKIRAFLTRSSRSSKERMWKS